MIISEAISIGNQFILEQHGVTGEPTSANLMETNKQRFWSLMYCAELFHPELYVEGGIMDGGEVILHVVDATGHVLESIPPG